MTAIYCDQVHMNNFHKICDIIIIIIEMYMVSYVWQLHGIARGTALFVSKVKSLCMTLAKSLIPGWPPHPHARATCSFAQHKTSTVIEFRLSLIPTAAGISRCHCQSVCSLSVHECCIASMRIHHYMTL